MPIFEEKLICPLAVRFTQEHIRTTFRDGRVVEASMAEIRPEPGVGEYDLILCAPFPAIEIVRLKSPRQSSWRRRANGRSGAREEDRGEHWFTLDNRRLYCLQRTAAAHWPKRVAARVEILYADPGSFWRKYDSSTCGNSVTIAHSCRAAPLTRWDWRKHAAALQLGRGDALDARSPTPDIIDDKKRTVDELQNRPEEATLGNSPCALAELAHAAATSAATGEDALDFLRGQASCRLDAESMNHAEMCADDDPASVAELLPQTPSTTAASEEEVASTEEQVPMGELVPSVDKDLDAAACPHVHGAEDPAKDDPAADASRAAPTKSARGGPGCDLDMERLEALTNEAVKQIRKQVSSPANCGFVWIGSWNSYYAQHLGSLRSFIESRAQDFVVVPGEGKKYTVELAPAPSASPASDAKDSADVPGDSLAKRQPWRTGHGYTRPRRTTYQQQQHGPVQVAPRWVPKRALGGA